MTRQSLLMAAVMVVTFACGGQAPSALHAKIGVAGGELVGQAGTDFEGVKLVIPAGALAQDTEISISRVQNDPLALPSAAKQCGPEFAIEPAGLALASPATLTIPFDASTVEASLRLSDEVKVWVNESDHWAQRKQIDGDDAHVTVVMPQTTRIAAGVNPPKDVDVVKFSLLANPKFANCLAAYPGDAARAPSAEATVVRGELNDVLWLKAKNLKADLKFDLFTVEASSLKADGTPDPAFTNFGLAWYQSDLDVRDDHGARVTVRTILLDQIFGFDPRVGLAPTSTLHLGFWFNDPNDAAACGFDVTKPTPFNGDHKAGPLAMISVPNATTNLGPLCTKPDTSTTPAHCSP